MSKVQKLNSSQHPKSLLVTLLRLLCRQSVAGQEDANAYLDVHLVCRDGVVGWNRFLLAANSDLLRKALVDFDEESHATLLLPDVSVAMLSSMLKCTLNPAVRNDTLSVNELQVMQLLGFPVLGPASQVCQREVESQTENNKISNSELNLSFCMQESYVGSELGEDLEQNEEVDHQRGPSILGHHEEVDEDNLDNISLLSSTLSISDVSRLICMKNPDNVSDKKEALGTDVPGKCSLDGVGGLVVLPLPQEHNQPTTGPEPGSSSSTEHIITVDKQIDNCVKSAIEKYFDRESVINTPTLPNLTCDEHEEDELVNLVTFPLPTEEPMLVKKDDSNIDRENAVPCVLIPPAEDCSDIITNKTLSTHQQICELESTESSCQKREEWLCEESTELCDKETASHSNENKQSSPNVYHHEPPKSKSFKCPSPNCKLKFQRLLHYQRHVGSCIAKSGKVTSKGAYECEKCGKAFHHPDNLMLHEKYHADLLIEKECNICGMKGIMGRHALTAHMERFHSTKVPCPFCRKLSGTAYAFNKANTDELKATPGLLPLKLVFCHICQKGFSDKRSLLTHKKAHEDANHNKCVINISANETGAPGMSSKQEYVRCTECTKLFRNQQHLSSHQRRSHQKEIQECLKCGKKCKNLNQHDKVVHNGDEIIAQAMNESMDTAESCFSVTDDLLSSCKSKQLECQRCLKTFSSQYVLDSHTKRAHSDSSDHLQEEYDPQNQIIEGFKCDGCGKRYLNKSGLKRHVKEAHGENSFECTECGQFFPVKHSLERHFTNVHHPVRHSCPICKDIHVIHLKAHLTGPSHQMSSSQAQNLVDEAIGKFAARTHLPLDDVIRRRVAKDVIL